MDTAVHRCQVVLDNALWMMIESHQTKVLWLEITALPEPPVARDDDTCGSETYRVPSAANGDDGNTDDPINPLHFHIFMYD
jgi:hypothetical protein